jgi:hypothetical protein
VYQRFPLYLTVHPRGRQKVLQQRCWWGWKTKCPKQRNAWMRALALRRLHAKLSATVTGENRVTAVPHFAKYGVPAMIEFFAITYVDFTTICITSRRISFLYHFI